MGIFDFIPIVPPGMPGDWQSVGAAWGIVYAMFTAGFCFVANGCALFLVGLVGFFNTF